ncbi:MAG: discoidin domain-containing protein, partial [Sedimentisphaerales bacterium]|nr:discoidin domain-containing protein [Sedimentisphaerales bacterium]
MNRICNIMIIALCITGVSLARTVYVDGSVTATGDGSQAAPFKTIAEALAIIDPDLRILVAGGTYSNEPPNMAVRSNVAIIGSYDSSFTASDPVLNPTIIDMGRLTEQEQNRVFEMNGVSFWTIENLIIQNSTSGQSASTNNGGAIYIRGGSRGTIRGVKFINCHSRYEGGSETGPARDGGAICIRDASTVVIEDCVFDGCTAVSRGGAINMRSAGAGNNVQIRRCIFTNCGSRNGASSIHDVDSSSQVEIVNCLFINNGVDVTVPSGTAPSNYEISIADRRALIYNCTFVGNNCPDGFIFDIRDSTDAAAIKEIVNCIIANNNIAASGTTSTIFSFASGYNDTTTIKNNLFFSNSGLDPVGPDGATIIGTNGNITADPLFVDPDNGDYHLQAESPAVDAGLALSLVTDDFDHVARPVGKGYDIGAFEGLGSMDPFAHKVNVIAATASSSLNADSGPEKTIDGSGLDALDQHDTKVANMWISSMNQAGPVWIQYEFDKVYKLNQMWVWNANSGLEFLLGLGVRTAKIEYSIDGLTWTQLAGVPEFARGPGAEGYAPNTTVDLGGVPARFVRITCLASWGGGNHYSLSEVRFFYAPVFASNPKPANGAKAVAVDATLTWKPGSEAVLHQVYLGTDMQAVAASTTPVAVVTEPTYRPEDLLLATKYYWKIVEVNNAMSPSAWAGDVWSFFTLPYLVVDDFESYTNNSPKRVFQTWIDG